MPAPPPPPPLPPPLNLPQHQSTSTPNPFLFTVLNDHASPSTPAGASGSSTTTPARNNAPRPTSGATEQTTTTAFSATQGGLQARGKPYNTEPGERNRGAESYEERQRRSEASAILESAEMLIWYAGSRGESISQTRQHFQNILFGFADPEPVWRDEWEVPVEERVGFDAAVSPGGKGKGKEREREMDGDKDKGKGKKRMSVG